MFSKELKNRLLALKLEFEEGVLPNEIYLDMCRKLINELSPKDAENDKRNEIIPIDEPILKVSLKKSLVEEGDKRKYNRGLDLRRSYTKEEKLIVILLKESGKSAEEVGHLCGISRSNVEKWTNEKIKLPIIDLCTEMLHSNKFLRSHINFFEAGSRQDRLMDSVITYSTAVALLGTAAADLLMIALSKYKLISSYADSLSNIPKKRTRSVERESVLVKAAILVAPHVIVSDTSSNESSHPDYFDFEPMINFDTTNDADVVPLTNADSNEPTALDKQTMLFWLGESEEVIG